MEQNPKEIAEAAEKLYRSEFREECEEKHNNMFIVIDITKKDYHVSEHAEEVLRNARKASPSGIFHLMRVGAPGAVQVSHGYEYETSPSW